MKKRRGRGTIHQRGEDTWLISVSLGQDPKDPKKRLRKWETVKGTRKDAEKRLTEILHQVDKGEYVEASKVAFGEYLDRWLEMVKPKIAPATYVSYADTIRLHLKPSLGGMPLAKLQPMHLQDYYAKKLGEGLSPTSVLYHHRIIHHALKDAVRLQVATRNVADAVIPPEKAQREMRTLTREEVHRLLEAVKDTYMYMPTYLAVFTGMRLGEILGLRWQDVDLDAGTIRVNQTFYQRRVGEGQFKKPKTQKSRRTIEISGEVIKTLKRHRVQQAREKLLIGEAYEDSGLVCAMPDGRPINPPGFSSRFSRVARGLGLDISFHGLRHTHASLLLQQRVHPKIVSERLGHSNIGITLDTYTHLIPGIQREAAEKIEEALR